MSERKEKIIKKTGQYAGNAKKQTDKNKQESDSVLTDQVLASRNLFMEKLRAVSEIVDISGNIPKEAEIAEYFKGMELSEEQQKLICQYLKNDQNRTDTPAVSGREGQDAVKLAGAEDKAVDTAAEMPDSVFFQMYLEDLEKITPCTEQEEDKLYEQLAEGDERAVQKLSEQWMLRTLEVAKKKAVHAEHLADLVQEGNMGVFLVLKSMLGSEKRADIRKVLENAAEEAVETYLSEASAAENLDQSLLAKAALVYEAQTYLAENLQRMPSVKELSQYTRLQETELEDILSILKEKN